VLPSGEKLALTQTERIGPMLQGAIKVVEGRGYNQEGALVFNAFLLPRDRKGLARWPAMQHINFALIISPIHLCDIALR
jgi:hypothetical protein